MVNFNYESKELLSLDESSSSSEHCEVSSDGETPIAEVDNSIRRSRFPIFRPVAKAENLRFDLEVLNYFALLLRFLVISWSVKNVRIVPELMVTIYHYHFCRW